MLSPYSPLLTIATGVAIRRRLWSWTTRFDIHSFNLTRPRGEGNRTSPEEHQITSYNLACVVSAKLQNKKYKKTFFLFSPLNHQTPKRSKSKISQKKYVSKTLFSHLDYFFFPFEINSCAYPRLLRPTDTG